MSEEIWKDINGYEGYYQVSSLGRVRSLDRTVVRSKKIYQYTIDGELVNIFPSSHECERNGYNRAHIYQCCIGKYKQHKGYIWRYEPMQPLIDTLKDAS